MSYVVTVENAGATFYLRSTVWAFAAERATVHATREEAAAALAKAKKFMKAATFRKAVIREAAAA